MRALVLIALTAVMATACARSPSTPAAIAESTEPTVAGSSPSPSPSFDVFLPTYPDWDVLPAAQVGGRLIEEGGCLWLEHTDGERSLALWPSGSRIERDGGSSVVVNSNGARAPIGAEVLGGGGEFGGPDHYDFVVETIGEEVPDHCRGDDSYLIVYDLRPVDE
jgi:hypothetical protein